MDRQRLSAQGRRVAIATPHAAATDAGMQAFKAGGNAADAAIAANAVLAVAYPHMCGIGGDFFAIIASGDSRIVVNGSGAVALGLTAEDLRRTASTMPAYGPLSISVPGTVAAWGEVLARYGRLPFGQAMMPAAALAEEGVSVAGSLARAIVAHQNRLKANPVLADLMMPSGRPLLAGERLRQPALAASLRAIAGDGPSSFYHGRVGTELIRGLRALGSPFVAEDFARHQTELTSPLGRTYRDREVLVPPPNSQGFVLEEILGAIQQAAIEPDHLGAEASVIARLFLLASSDRDRLNADPRRSPFPEQEVLGEGHLRELVARARSAPVPGLAGHAATGDTVGIVAAESNGLWVSINQSLYDAFGSGILEPSTGILCHNRGSAVSLDPRSPNLLAGGRRPAHTLMPVMALAGGTPAIASATMGRSAHAQIHAELLMAVIDQKREAFEAVDRPRWLAGGLRADAGVVAENRVPQAVLHAFERAGMGVDTLEAWDEQVGHAQLIVQTADGILHAASDPRADGAAAAA